MIHLIRAGSAVVLSALLLCSTGVFAEGTGRMTFSAIQLSAFDLTPDDGAAAGFDVGALSTQLVVYREFGSEESLPPPYQPASLRLDDGPSHIEARTGGPLGDLISEAVVHPNVGLDNRHGSYAYQDIALTLRPHTVLLFTGHFSMLADSVVEMGQLEPNVFAVFNEASAQINDLGYDALTQMNYRLRAYAGMDEHNSMERDFLLTYANATDHDLAVSLSLSAHSEVSARLDPLTPPVPEPAAVLLWCAGLAVTAAMVRQRRKCPAASHRALSRPAEAL